MNRYCFDSTVSAVAHPCLDKTVLREFWHGFCCEFSEIEFTDTELYVFSIGKTRHREIANALYGITVDQNGVSISAHDEKGLLCGYMSLLRKIRIFEDEMGKEYPSIEYCDEMESPVIQNRMVHFCVFPDTKYYEIQRFIRLCGVLKYSHIVVEFWGMLKYDALKELSWNHGFTKDDIRPLFKEANDMGIEIIPMFNHWGHASASRVIHGKHVVLDQNLRLQPYFSDDGWTWQIEKPNVRRLLRSIRGELIELCGDGKYFHLGCDEPYGFRLTQDTAHIVTDYLNEISGELKKCGRRAIVWGDMLVAKRTDFNPENSYTASCPDKTVEKKLLSCLNKDIVIADWQYNVRVAPVETAMVFKKAGFDVLLCPWDKTYGVDSLSPCAKTVKEENLLGLLHTTWHTLSSGMPEVAHAAGLCWERANSELPTTDYGPYTSTLIRSVYHPKGVYEKSGWAPYEIENKAF